MAVKPALQLKIGQQLTMTPALQQAIKLLQLSSLELQTEIQTVLESNPMLEKEEESSDISIDEVQPTEKPDDDFGSKAWEDRVSTPSKPLSSEFEPQQAQQLTLKDHLIWQMELTPFTPTDRLIAKAIIEDINEDGFFEGQIDEMTAMFDPSYEIDTDDLNLVLKRIQHFDPVGVGARNLQECLIIQLDALPTTSKVHERAKRCLESFMPLLGKRDYANLKRKLRVSEQELKDVLKLIQSLNPRPGGEIGTRVADYIIPDAFVIKRQGEWVVELNPDNAPKISINDHYARLVNQAQSSSDSQYIKDQLQEARFFLKSLQNRHDTLLKVVNSIVEHQQEFLEHGEAHMKPMILQDVAQAIDMHESTVSRATTQKFVHTPRGTYELKFFFSSHVTNDQGDSCSSTAIRALIKELVANENPNKPLSDAKIAAHLEDKGIRVARRTVAKYRESMKIQPSNERKQIV